MKRVLIGALLAFAASAPAAEAATLINAGGTLTYSAPAGTKTDIHVSSASLTSVRLSVTTLDPITMSGCVETGVGRYICDDVTSVAISLGYGDDEVDAWGLIIPLRLDGGPNDDILYGGGSADIINGGDGEDAIRASADDIVSGGNGLDSVSYERARWETGTFDITLDGVDNDGAGANLLPDVEDVNVFGPEPVRMTGSERPNSLRGGGGDDVLTGGGGSDTLDGFIGDDTLHARDGVADRVVCGPGVDVAIVDQFDHVSDSCESVQVGEAAYGLEDRPPTVAWERSSARLTVGSATTLRVSPADDLGVTSVRFLDDGRTVCTDTTTPFTCDYTPRASDVGANTLIAIASDAGGQTASAVREATVRRIQPRKVSLRVTRRGNRFTAAGKVTLPKGVKCAGRVTVRASGLASRSARLTRACTYRVTMTRGAARTIRFVTTYEGTPAIASKRSRVRVRTP